jgi:hypothetical protein
VGRFCAHSQRWDIGSGTYAPPDGQPQPLCQSAGCIEPPEPGDSLCEVHLRYVMEVIAFLDGSASGLDFDSPAMRPRAAARV